MKRGLEYLALIMLLTLLPLAEVGMGSAPPQGRIVIAQSLYFVGVLLGVWNTYVGIGFIVLLQLNSAIAPKIYPLDKF